MSNPKKASGHVIGAGDKRPWFKGEAHGHHTYGEPLDIQAARYRERGYQFVAYCAKDTEAPLGAHEKYSTPEFLVVDGVEQAFRLKNRKFGHVVGFPIYSPYPSPTTDEWLMKEGYAKLKAKNPDTLLVVAHPHDKRWCIDDIMEAWECGVELFELNSIDMKHGEFETELWDQALSLGARFPGLLSNDVHHFGDIDAYGYIMIQADSLTQENMVAAIRAGAFYAVESGCQAIPRRYELIESAAGRFLEVEAPGAIQIVVAGDGGQVRKIYPGERAHHPVSDSNSYLRAEIVDGNGSRIFLQPFFMK